MLTFFCFELITCLFFAHFINFKEMIYLVLPFILGASSAFASGLNTSDDFFELDPDRFTNGSQFVGGGRVYQTQSESTAEMPEMGLPSGLIFMFRGNCPKGSRLLTDMAGRVPVGAGHLNDGTLNFNYKLNSTGGVQRHRLSIGEMPSHAHSIRGDILGGTGYGVVGPDGRKGDWFRRNNRSEYQGGNEFHENRMPYKVVNFCEAE